MTETAMIHPGWMVLAQTEGQTDAAPPARGVLGAEGSEGGADATQEGTAGDGTGTQQPASPFGGFMLPLLLMMVVLMVFTALSSGRKQKREQAQRDSMLNALSRSDRVEMIGGEIGTVVEIDNDTVVVRVHEGSDTRIRYTRSAVKSVIRASGNHGADLPDDKNAA